MKLNLRAQSRYLQRKKSAMLGAKGLWDGSIKILPNLHFYSRFTKKSNNLKYTTLGWEPESINSCNAIINLSQHFILCL